MSYFVRGVIISDVTDLLNHLRENVANKNEGLLEGGEYTRDKALLKALEIWWENENASI